jgi:CubicO group peptidase (beta-lactamase class C family)
MAKQTHSAKHPAVPFTKGKTDVSPEAVGFNPVKLDRLDSYFLDLIKKGSVQCASYLLARRGKVFACAAMGRRHFQKEENFLPDSIRMIGSITKMITAIALFQLWERGRFNLYTRVVETIKEFDTPLHRPINIGQLLTHTSGLRADGGYFLEPYPTPLPLNETRDTWIRTILQGPLQSEPGKVWSYCSAGYAILGEIVSRVAGQSYADYVAQNILAPLKMEDTCFKVPAEKAGRLCLTRDAEIEWLREWTKPDSPYPPACYQLMSTLPDLHRLGQCLLQNGELEGARLLGRKSIEYLRRNQLHAVPAFSWGRKIVNFQYGMGVAISKDDFSTPSTFGHEGYGASSLFIDPENELVSLFFVPTAEGTLTEAVDNPRAIIWSGLF